MLMNLKLLLMACSCCCCLAQDTDHDHDHDHDHEEEHHDEHGVAEFGASFETPEDLYYWNAAKVDSEYAAETMLMAILPIADTGHEELEEAEQSLEGMPFDLDSCPNITVFEDLAPSSSLGSCWNLQFDQNNFVSSFRLDLSNIGAIALFTEHNPVEFENGLHYLVNSAGEHVEVVEELEHDDHGSGSSNTGEAIGASIIVLLVTFSGAVFMCSCTAKFEKTHEEKFNMAVYAFAAGALISTALYLIMLEASHLIGTSFDEEAEIAWRWGTCVLGGFLLSTFADLLFGLVGLNTHSHVTPNQTKENTGREMAEIRVAQAPAPAVVNNDDAAVDVRTPTQNEIVPTLRGGGVSGKVAVNVGQGSCSDDPHAMRVFISIVIGDFLHNFVDGIFIGTAFSLCDSSTGWAIALTTAFHELAQELADYRMLVQEVGLTPFRALAVNFLAGMSVVIGTMVERVTFE
jgi:zinc transporter ZupT